MATSNNYASRPYSHDEEDSRVVQPLIETNSNGAHRRRIGIDEDLSQKKSLNQFQENYTYVSATKFTPPTPMGSTGNMSINLKSQTFGGLGPVDPNDIDKLNDESKLKAQKFYTRVLRGCTNCLRVNGCSNYEMLATEGPNADYYRDDFNDQPTSCSIGTSEEDGIWMNRSDVSGTVMAMAVWVLLFYSAITISFLAETGGVTSGYAMIYVVLSSLALASHAKTQFTDPGAVASSAQPMESFRKLYPNGPLTLCSQCQTFKPPFSHHCRICNRCISGMDHHCPWMNNCIGAGNMKHFILFLIYTWLCTCMSLCLLGSNYFFCASEDCTYSIILVQLARVMTVLATGTLFFTSSMIMNVTYGIMTGIGTIDRLKKKATDTTHFSSEEPIPLKNIFGIAGYHTWLLPIDPVFEDFDRVMGYSTPQRLLREQMKEKSPP